MKKKKYRLSLVLILILIAIGIGFFISKKPIKLNTQIQNTKDSVNGQNAIRDTIPPQDINVKDSTHVQDANKDEIPSNWETYTNNKLGFTFQYPNTWYKYGEDTNVIDRYGTIIAIKINFIDTVSHTTLLIKYHLAPKGAELYQQIASQNDSVRRLHPNDCKQITVAGQKAIETISTVRIDGKEHILIPPDKLILVDLLDQLQTGEIQMQFRTPLTDEKIEVAKFERLLSTFKYTN